MLAVIAVLVAVTVVVLRSGSGHSSQSSTGSNAASAGVASADDRGPITVMTDHPSCAPWTPVINALVAVQDQTGWAKRDASISASAWTTAQRSQFQTTATAMLHAADQTAALAKLTPHRVMRELYEHSIAYWHAYADSIANYTPNDDHLARVATATTSTVGAICNAITYGSAVSRGPLVAKPAGPTQASSPADQARSAPFLTSANSVCTDVSADGTATSEWNKIEPSIPASQWTPEQKALNDAAGPVIDSHADKFEQLGRRSGNPQLEDFAILTAQYARAYVQGLPTYVPGGQYLYSTSSYSNGAVRAACEAVGG